MVLFINLPMIQLIWLGEEIIILKKSDFYFSVILIALGVLVFTLSLGMPKMPAFFPKIISILLLILGVILMIESIGKKEGENLECNFVVIVSIIVGIIVYNLLLEKIGYLISTLLLVGYTVYILGYRTKKLLIIMCISSLLIFLVFKVLLNVPLPMGFLGGS